MINECAKFRLRYTLHYFLSVAVELIVTSFKYTVYGEMHHTELLSRERTDSRR